jgi:hypothetical protein
MHGNNNSLYTRSSKDFVFTDNYHFTSYILDTVTTSIYTYSLLLEYYFRVITTLHTCNTHSTRNTTSNVHIHSTNFKTKNFNTILTYFGFWNICFMQIFM